MTGQPSPQTYVRRAESALSEARLLLRACAVPGTCNRAYYAMFNAAHAALFAIGAEGLTAPIKTHHGLIARFGQAVVVAGYLPGDFGHALNRAEDLRRLADYSDDAVELTDAAWAVERAEAFIDAVKRKFGL